MSAAQRDALVQILRQASRPISGPELATRLGVTTRTVRTYIRQLNHPDRVIVSSRAGYSLHPDWQRRLAAEDSRQTTLDTPDRRLAYLCRHLAQTTEAVSIHQLADEMFVSESTIEADLGRAREMLRQFEMKTVRTHDLVRLAGPERGRRRLVRHLVYGSASGLVPATWNALVKEFQDIDVPALRSGVKAALDDTGLQFHEYALNDVIVHLTVAIDRVKHGHTLPVGDIPPGIRDQSLVAAVEKMADVVRELTMICLPEPEKSGLYNILVVRGIVRTSSGALEVAIDPDIQTLVANILDELSAKYLLSVATPATAINLTLHTQGLLARCRSGTTLPHALGDSFKNSHPLLHDLALDFARSIEERTGQIVPRDELDYLALHMGMQYMSSFERRDIVTITLVIPKFYNMAGTLADQLRSSLGNLAVIETVSQALDFDFRNASSDLIVSTVPPATATVVPAVLIEPLPTRDDIARVNDAVRAERERAIRRRIRGTLSTLIDPRLFVHLSSAATQTDALSILAGKLVGAGYTDDAFLADVLDRESRSSTAFGGDFAIPHSMRMDAHATAIAALISDDGISWGTSRVHLVLLFALSADGRQVFRDVLEEITRLLADGRNVQELIKAGTDPHRFVSTFMDLLDGEPGAN